MKLILLAVQCEFSLVLMGLKRIVLQVLRQYLKQLVKITINCFGAHTGKEVEKGPCLTDGKGLSMCLIPCSKS